MVCARQDDGGLRVPLTDEARKLNPVGAGKHQVHDSHVELFILEHANGRVSTRRDLDVEALEAQTNGDDSGMTRFVFDHQQSRQGAPAF